MMQLATILTHLMGAGTVSLTKVSFSVGSEIIGLGVVEIEADIGIFLHQLAFQQMIRSHVAAHRLTSRLDLYMDCDLDIATALLRAVNLGELRTRREQGAIGVDELVLLLAHFIPMKNGQQT